MQQVDVYLQELSANFFASQLQFEQLPQTPLTELEEKLIKAIEKMQISTQIDASKTGNLAQIYLEGKEKLEKRIDALEQRAELYSHRIQQLETENKKLAKVLAAVFAE